MNLTTGQKSALETASVIATSIIIVVILHILIDC